MEWGEKAHKISIFYQNTQSPTELLIKSISGIQQPY